jgi:hypothetical protein
LTRRRFTALASAFALAWPLSLGCGSAGAPSGPGSGDPAAPGASTLALARAQLLSRLDTLRVAGAVKTSDGILLPETIRIEVRTEVCTETRAPGSRFWSLDYDTCFTFTSVDTVGPTGDYSVALPCIDADRDYQGSFAFGELRLVPKGPVSFLAESDGGWTHQETFSSARSQQRDLLLTFEPHLFYVVSPKASVRERPDSTTAELRGCPFGQEVNVIRFHLGWAECLFPGSIGWMEMKCLGTAEDVKEREAEYKKAGLIP